MIEGDVMSNLTSKMDDSNDNPIFDKLEILFNMMVLNVLWIICSIPILTIGASSAALNYTCIKLRRHEGDNVVKMFFHSFASSIKQGLVLTTGMLSILIIICTCMIQVLGNINSGDTISIAFAVILVLVLFSWILIYTYLFMVLSRFDNSLFRTITNSIYLILKDKMTALKVLGIECFGLIIIPVFIWRYFPVLFPILIFIGVPTMAYITANIFNKEVFADYVK